MPQAFRDLALDLGLETDVPLFEIASYGTDTWPDRPQDAVIAEVSAVLVRLFGEGRIVVYAGPWELDDPPRVYGTASVDLLSDARNYRVEDEAAFGLRRVYYGNVDNLIE